MTTDTTELSVAPRAVLRKRVRYLRRQGLVPANLYGPGIQSTALQVESAALLRTLAKVGRNTPVTLNVDGRNELALIWSVQRHPLTEAILHVDFFKVDPTRRIETTVPIRMVGKAPAETEGAIIIQTLHSLHIECPMVAIPRHLEVDVSTLQKINDLVLVKDIQVGPEVKIVTPLDQPVVRAGAPRAEEVAVPAAAEAAPEAEAAAPEAGAPAPEAEAKEEQK